MRKVENFIILFIAVVFLIVVFGSVNRIVVANTCNAHGYVSANPNRYSSYCTKVENGNTIIVHVDSLR